MTDALIIDAVGTPFGRRDGMLASVIRPIWRRWRCERCSSVPASTGRSRRRRRRLRQASGRAVA